MNTRRTRREALGLSQTDAAGRAGVSLATWRRWEEAPSKVRPSTRASCDKVLDREAALHRELAAQASKFEAAWGDCPYLTPRQASSIASSLDWWCDLYIDEWLKDPTSEPLHEVSPFDQLDLRVMMLVNENRAWAAKARERCVAVSAEIEKGVLPFDRDGCYFDELLMALALPDAAARLADMPELFEDIQPRLTGANGEDWTLDDEWDAVSDTFDDMCRWDEWEVPLFANHPLLAKILAQTHPFTWFDPGQGTGAGYLQRLVGLVVDETRAE